MQIFDTHTHLNVEEFAGKEQEELDLAKEMGVVAHNIVGFDKPTIERGIALADQHIPKLSHSEKSVWITTG